MDDAVTVGESPAMDQAEPHEPALAPADTLSAPPVRVLWKGALVLHDGTQLPGATIVTTMRPWTHLRGDLPEAPATDEALEAEAELCFALEMVRHHPLRVLPSQAPAPASKEGALASPQYEASGQIQMHLEAADEVTWTFLEHFFCWVEEDNATERALTLTFDPSLGTSAMSLSTTRSSQGVFEFVLLARQYTPTSLALVVGRRIQPRREEVPTREVRPDDPLPRVKVEADAWDSSEEDTSMTKMDARVRRRGQLSVREGHGHTPGRRGEKRAQRVYTDKLLVKKEAPRSPPMYTPASKEKWRPVSSPIPIPAPCDAQASMEVDNRASIKRLVKYQLAGRGMDRDHPDYSTCFQTAYAGTCLVFRHVLSTQPLDKSNVAHVITAHLDMYVNPSHLRLCAPISTP